MNGFFSYDGDGAPPPPEPAAPRAILADLDGDDWDRFIGYTAQRRYPAGAVIFNAGETAPALGFVASGRVELHGQVGRSQRGEGEVFGILSFLDGAPSGFTVSVTPQGPAEVLLLTPEALQQLAAWQPRIALALLHDLGAFVATRLRRLQAGD